MLRKVPSRTKKKDLPIVSCFLCDLDHFDPRSPSTFKVSVGPKSPQWPHTPHVGHNIDFSEADTDDSGTYMAVLTNFFSINFREGWRFPLEESDWTVWN